MSLIVESKELKNGSLQIKFEGDIIINNVAQMKEELSQDYSKFDILNLDLGKVQKIDTAGFQLFLSFKKQLSGSSTQIIFKKMSQSVTDISNLYDVDLNKIEVS